jgi:peptidoglycan/xylan/chitin deacetylase (PgdA/CDA1 family)
LHRPRLGGVATTLALLVVRPVLGPAVAAAAPASPSPTPAASGLTIVDGAVVRGPTHARRLALVFTGHEFAEGAAEILDELHQRRIAAAFFFTGAFLNNPAFGDLVRRALREGHYLGPHSDAHLLYCPWTGPKTTLVSREEFDRDLDANLAKLERLGVPRGSITHFVPPYEWANEEIAAWSRARGLLLANPTPGTRAPADYTEDQDPRFVSSQQVLDSVLAKERSDPHGLNGFLLLMHVGAGPRRTDKLHRHLGELLDALAARGYECVRLDAMLPAGAWRLGTGGR